MEFKKLIEEKYGLIAYMKLKEKDKVFWECYKELCEVMDRDMNAVVSLQIVQKDAKIS